MQVLTNYFLCFLFKTGLSSALIIGVKQIRHLKFVCSAFVKIDFIFCSLSKIKNYYQERNAQVTLLTIKNRYWHNLYAIKNTTTIILSKV